MNILGIHGGVTQLHHDPAAALLIDGKIVAAIEEERLNRQKGGLGHIPVRAIEFCLRHASMEIRDIDLVVHSGETNHDLEIRIKQYLNHYFGSSPEVILVNHQMAHLASAYYASGFKEAYVLSYDGYGDNLSAAFGFGSSNELKMHKTFGLEDSLGLFYSVMTSFLGFEPADAEYRVMGLAAHGKPGIELKDIISIFHNTIQIDNRFFRGSDRVFSVASSQEDYDPPLRSRFEPWYRNSLCDLLGPPRRLNEPITQRHADIAYATQKAFEQASFALVNQLLKDCDFPVNLALAGGCALNCATNGLLLKHPRISKMFVQPAASDRGIALGCAYLGAAKLGDKVLPMNTTYLGGQYSDDEIRSILELLGVSFVRSENIISSAAELLSSGKIIGWFQGRSEYGPRALGNRSILADPRNEIMRDMINKRIKFREEFRPFAPVVASEFASQIFDLSDESPFMTCAVQVRESWKRHIPAVVHKDGTARVQTCNATQNILLYKLLLKFYQLTSVPVLLNTSFNIKGEPIVETPQNAVATFFGSGMDDLIIGNYIVGKSK